MLVLLFHVPFSVTPVEKTLLSFIPEVEGLTPLRLVMSISRVKLLRVVHRDNLLFPVPIKYLDWFLIELGNLLILFIIDRLLVCLYFMVMLKGGRYRLEGIIDREIAKRYHSY